MTYWDRYSKFCSFRMNVTKYDVTFATGGVLEFKYHVFSSCMTAKIVSCNEKCRVKLASFQ